METRILDLTWGGAGPTATEFLAKLGAEVIKVESEGRLDLLRLSRPFAPDRVGQDTSVLFADRNTGKYSISLNLKHPRGIEVAKRLVRLSDVVMQSMRPGAIEKMGLGYAELKKIKPDIIMVNSSIVGQKGAYQNFRGWGPFAAAMSGHYHLTGWPDGEPTSWLGAGIGDQMQPVFTAQAILAALCHRSETGEGQYIDSCQIELMVSSLSPAVLDYIVNGRQPSRMGNKHPEAAPHGAFRCKGDDRWCAIAVFSDEEWEALCKVMGNPLWAERPCFSTLRLRKENEDELERLIEGWTVNYSAEEVMERLQAAGVRAGVVQSPEDMVDQDPQLKARAFRVPVNHPLIGTYYHNLAPFKLSKQPLTIEHPAPLLGEHNGYVYTELLGMSNDEVMELQESGVLG